MSCSSCDRTRIVLVTVGSPRGEYLLCGSCFGRDREPRPADLVLGGGKGSNGLKER